MTIVRPVPDDCRTVEDDQRHRIAKPRRHAEAEATGVFTGHVTGAPATCSTTTSSAPLRDRLSPARLAPYQAATGGDLAAALRLYEWNSTVAGAFWITLGHLEILVRNALHEQLTIMSRTRHGSPDWMRTMSGPLTSQAVADIREARARATSAGKPETPGRVVAELSFGFWRYLLASRYERTMWRTGLYDCALPSASIAIDASDYLTA